MEPEVSLPHSQVPATYSYPETYRFSPCLHIPFPEDPKIHLNIILPSKPGVSKWPPSSGFCTKNMYTPQHTPHTLFILRPSHSSRFDVFMYALPKIIKINLLKPTGYVCTNKFNIQQLYALLTLYLCVLYLPENKQRLMPLTS
jgi:hypothetical protein